MIRHPGEGRGPDEQTFDWIPASAGMTGFMKSLEQQMAFYAAYHRNPWNRLTHFIGVPVIIFAIFVAPIFLAAEVAFALGLRGETRRRVEELSHRHD